MTGKKLLFLFIIIGIGIFVLLLGLLGYRATWQLWNVPAYSSPFLDLQLITAGAESHAAGYDPTFLNPFDPFQRPVNYPRIWNLFFLLPVDLSNTVQIGLALIAAFAVCLFIFVPSIDNLTAILMGSIIFSSDVLLGIERGNVDIVFFVLLAISLYLSDRNKAYSFGILVLSILFKIYPAFSAGYFLEQNNEKSFRWIMGSFGVLLIYLLITFQDMVHIFQLTVTGRPGGGTYLSFGANVLSLFLASNFHLQVRLVNTIFSLLALIILFSTVFAALRSDWSLSVDDAGYIKAFRAGAGIYIGAFLLGSNYDYRFMFLIFIIPQLAIWIRKKNSSGLAGAALVGVFLSCWNLLLQKIVLVVFSVDKLSYLYFDEFINWGLFVILIYLFAASSPDWIVERGKKMLRIQKPDV